jgi:nitrate/TMAO reductase-like tetraheme cytochrome c subunit
VRAIKTKSDGYHSWTEDEIEKFEKHHKIAACARWHDLGEIAEDRCSSRHPAASRIGRDQKRFAASALSKVKA